MKGSKSWVVLPQFGADLGEDFVITPGGGRVGFLMMIGLQDEVTGGEENLLDLGVLAHFFAGGLDDELIMRARCGGAILHSFAFEADPVDAHLGHVGVGKVARVFGGKAGELRDLLPGEGPVQPGKSGARVLGVLRIFHHLPETFETGVAFAVEGEGRGGKIGEQAQFISLGKDDFARSGCLRKNFPGGRAIRRDRLPPLGRILAGGMAGGERQEQNGEEEPETLIAHGPHDLSFAEGRGNVEIKVAGRRVKM
jgi:hypothetical protein